MYQRLFLWNFLNFFVCIGHQFDHQHFKSYLLVHFYKYLFWSFDIYCQVSICRICYRQVLYVSNSLKPRLYNTPSLFCNSFHTSYVQLWYNFLNNTSTLLIVLCCFNFFFNNIFVYFFAIKMCLCECVKDQINECCVNC